MVGLVEPVICYGFPEEKMCLNRDTLEKVKIKWGVRVEGAHIDVTTLEQNVQTYTPVCMVLRHWKSQKECANSV